MCFVSRIYFAGRYILVSIMEATVPCLEAGRVGKEAGRKVAQLVLVEAEGAEDPEAGQGPRMDGGQLVVGQQEGVKVGQLGQRVAAHSAQSESTQEYRKMRLIEGNRKMSSSKKN